MKYDQSLLKKKSIVIFGMHCSLQKRYRSLALNIGLFKKKIGKMSFGTYIHSLQSSVFATRKKKGVTSHFILNMEPFQAHWNRNWSLISTLDLKKIRWLRHNYYFKVYFKSFSLPAFQKCFILPTLKGH